MDRLQAIEIFVKVAELRSFTAAAEELKLSRTLVSDRVKDLEGRLGVRLLQRTTRRVALTESGAAYLERVSAGIAVIEEADAEAARLTVKPRGILRVNAPVSFGARHLAPAVGTYLASCPEVGIDLTLNDRIVNLIEDNVDLVIRIGQLKDSGLVARKIAASRMVLCASTSYLRAHSRIRRPEDLVQHECLNYAYWSDGLSWKFTRRNEQKTVRVRSRLWCNNGDALTEAAGTGAGIALQPYFIAGPAIEKGSLVEVLPAWNAGEVGIYAVYAPGQHVPAKTRSFIDHLAKHFAASRYWKS